MNDTQRARPSRDLSDSAAPTAAAPRATATDFAEWLTLAQLATDKKLVKLAGLPTHLTPTHLRICQFTLSGRFPGTPFASPDLHKLARALGRYSSDDRSPERREIKRIAASGLWAIEDPTGFPTGSIRFLRPSWAQHLLDTKRSCDEAKARLPRQTLLFEQLSDKTCPDPATSLIIGNVVVTPSPVISDKTCPKDDPAPVVGFEYLKWFWAFQKPAGEADEWGVIHAPSLYLTDRQKLVAMILLAHAGLSDGFCWIGAKGIAARIKPQWVMRQTPRVNHIYQDLAVLKRWRFIRRGRGIDAKGGWHDGFYLLDPTCWLAPSIEPDCPDMKSADSPAGGLTNSPASGPAIVPQRDSEQTHQTEPITVSNVPAAQAALAAPAEPAVAGSARQSRNYAGRARHLWDTAPESRMTWIERGCALDHCAAQRRRAILNAGGGDGEIIADEIIQMAAIAALASSIERSGNP